MAVEWDFNDDDVAMVIEIVERQSSSPIVLDRIRRNVDWDYPPKRDRFSIWRVMLACLLTTMQRSGPDSHVNQFLRLRPSPLGLELLRGSRDRETLVRRAIEEAGGIRFKNRLASQISTNLDTLDAGGWEVVETTIETLASRPLAHTKERAAARTLKKTFKGLGPKQSRNFLQMLGWTQYEIPIDSRISRWFQQTSFPAPLDSLLSKARYYDDAMDHIIKLCEAAEVIPTVFDASVFTSFDPDGWEAGETRWGID